MSSDGSLWAITSFFNSSGSRRRIDNYRRFRAALPVPLATVELGFGGTWHLTSRDAELYVPIGDGDVLWQKERLLNLLLPRLPPQCRHVAWLDADVLLADGEWPRRAAEALSHAPLVQLFSELVYLGPDGVELDGPDAHVPSVMAEVQSGPIGHGGLGACHRSRRQRNAGDGLGRAARASRAPRLLRCQRHRWR